MKTIIPNNVNRTDVVSTQFIRNAYNLCLRGNPEDPVRCGWSIGKVMTHCGFVVPNIQHSLDVANFADMCSRWDGDNTKDLMSTIMYRNVIRLAAHASVCGVQFAAMNSYEYRELLELMEKSSSTTAYWGEIYYRMCKQLHQCTMDESLSPTAPCYVLPLSRTNGLTEDGKVCYASTLHPGAFPTAVACPSVFMSDWQHEEGHRFHGPKLVRSEWFAGGVSSVEDC